MYVWMYVCMYVVCVLYVMYVSILPFFSHRISIVCMYVNCMYVCGICYVCLHTPFFSHRISMYVYVVVYVYCMYLLYGDVCICTYAMLCYVLYVMYARVHTSILFPQD